MSSATVRREREDGEDATRDDGAAVKRARADDAASDGRAAVEVAVDRFGRRVRAGDRLEVQWEVEPGRGEGGEDGEARDEDETEVAVTWWPCVVCEGDAEGKAKAGTAFALLYDARDGFEAELRKVSFLSGEARELTHADEDGVFRWRREGDDDDDDDECEGDGCGADVPTTMREILEAQGALDAASGESLENASMAAFATLPMNQQMNMASAFAGFKDKLMQRLSGLAAQKGADGVVTKDDIENILSDIRNE